MKTRFSSFAVRGCCWALCFCLTGALAHAADQRQPAAAGKAKGKADVPRPLTNEQRIKRNEALEKKAMEREKLKEQLLGAFVAKLQKAAQAAAKSPGTSEESRKTARTLIEKAQILTAYHDAMKLRNEAYDKEDGELYKNCSEKMQACQAEYPEKVGEAFPNFDVMVARVLYEQYQKDQAARAAKQKEAGGK